MRTHPMRQNDKVDEMREFAELRERLVRLETILEALGEDRETVKLSKETALHAIQAAKSAHHRLDDMKEGQRWIWRTIAGTILASAASILTSFITGS